MVKQLETQVRTQNGMAVVELHGEINGSADLALNTAYAEGRADQSRCSCTQFSESGLHQQHWYRPDCWFVSTGSQITSATGGMWIK